MPDRPRYECADIVCGVRGEAAAVRRPTVVGYTREDVRTRARLMARSIRASGGRSGDRVHVAYGLFTGASSGSPAAPTT